MNTTASRDTALIALALAALLAATRGQFLAGFEHLPEASWAVFFLAGMYLRPAWAFPALIVEAAALDMAAIGWGGVSDFCMSPAYWTLLPAYGALWLAGRWYGRHYRLGFETTAPLVLSVLAGAIACELFSSGGFYFLSGRFPDTSLAEFGARSVRYFPAYLASMAMYVALATLLHAILAASTRQPAAR
jgi:hypothetical protein